MKCVKALATGTTDEAGEALDESAKLERRILKDATHAKMVRMLESPMMAAMTVSHKS